MDTKKIGEFIASSRKSKCLTQEELGEKLGVSNKTISRWENGNYMPDLSLLKPLSDLLDVSVNELLSGEKISDENLAVKSEENLIKLTELIELKTMRYGVIGMAIFFMVLVIISLFKNVSAASSVSLLCAYNSVTFLSRYKIQKDNSNLVAGVMFFIATILNTIAFILT